MGEHQTETPPADPEEVARAIVLRRLTASPRTRAELERSLRERNVPDDVRERVLDRFTEVGLIDDAQYAAAFTESRRQRSGWSRRAIEAKLRERGVPRDVITEALVDVGGDDELRTARELASRRWERSGALAPEVRRRRMAAMLARRGYSATVVATVLTELGSGEPDVD